MFQSFTLRNFRGFRDLTVAPLARVNLIAGQNNAGKTALLEALMLHTNANAPEVSLNLTTQRGVGTSDTVEIWRWLFFDRQIKLPIELTSISADDIRRSLYLRLTRSEQVQVTTRGGNDFADLTRGSLEPDMLLLEYEDSTGQTQTLRLTTKPDNDGTLQVVRSAIPTLPRTVFINTDIRSLANVPEWWSELEAVGRQEAIVPPLRLLEPRLQRLTVLVRRGSAPMIYGDIGLRELVPVPLMGEGVGRLLAILLAIASVPHGIVLIDEIENGFHHSVMTAVWQALAAATRHSDVQIFATTHSWECIQAAHTAFEMGGSYDLRLHRLERSDPTIQAVTYDQETLATSIAMNLETR